MERLEMMKETLMSAVQAQMANLQTVNTKELGEAIDMIKDLAETMYYCTITEAMEEKAEKEEQQQPIAYYSEKIREPYPYYMDRDIDKGQHRMYYSDGARNGGTSTHDNNNSSSNSHSSRQYSEPMYEYNGRSPERRRMYMETRKGGADRQTNIKELEMYVQELGTDLTEMIAGATLEEKQLLQRKLAALANKIPEA